MSNIWGFRIDFQNRANIPVTDVAQQELDAAIREAQASRGEILTPQMVEQHPKLRDIFRDDPALYMRIEGERNKPFTAVRILMQRTRALPTGRPNAYIRLP